MGTTAAQCDRRYTRRPSDRTREGNGRSSFSDGAASHFPAQRKGSGKVGCLHLSQPGGTGAAYDELNGQGLYVLRDGDAQIRYVGRGDAPARIDAHATAGSGKEDLVGDILFDNNLPAPQAISLEHELMQSLGGPKSVNPNTPLRNKVQGIAESNPNFGELEFAADDDLFIETLRRAKLLDE